MKIENLTIKYDDIIYNALKKIDYNKKGFLIVIDSKSIVLGTLTEGDIRRSLLLGKVLDDRIDYNKKFISLSDLANLSEVINIFKDQKIKFLPIIDNKGVLKNVITKSNLHAILLQDIQPDVKYDFINVDDSIIDYEIFQRPWGFYKTTILSAKFQSKLISVNPKGVLSLQKHNKREEYWIIVKGCGTVSISNSIIEAEPGRIIFIPKGCEHRMKNNSGTETLIFIEVQLGQYFGEDDIIRIEDEYGRA